MGDTDLTLIPSRPAPRCLAGLRRLLAPILPRGMTTREGAFGAHQGAKQSNDSSPTPDMRPVAASYLQWARWTLPMPSVVG